MHFQGPCSYTLARDACEDGYPSEGAEPNFSVVQKNWRDYENANAKDVSWVKEVYITLYGSVSRNTAIV